MIKTKTLKVQELEYQIKNQDLIDVQLPWHDSEGGVISSRYYHYFTYKEILDIMDNSGLRITRRVIAGGKHGDANFFLMIER